MAKRLVPIDIVYGWEILPGEPDPDKLCLIVRHARLQDVRDKRPDSMRRTVLVLLAHQARDLGEDLLGIVRAAPPSSRLDS